MPGRHLTDHHVRHYMSLRTNDKPSVAAANAAISTASAYRIESAPRVQDFETEQVRVTSHCGFTLRKVFYSVPSRLIGQSLRVHLFADRLVLFLGGAELMTLRRGRPHDGGRRGHVVNYHHVIHALRRKPMALTATGCCSPAPPTSPNGCSPRTVIWLWSRPSPSSTSSTWW